MTGGLWAERDDSVGNGAVPHFSYSQLNRYLLCPEQYRLYYIENLRPRIAPAALVFGKVVHQALAELFGKQGDPLRAFHQQWNDIKKIDLDYGQRDSWEKLRLSGQGLLERFLQNELPRLGNIRASEKVFELAITSLDMPLIGVIDLLADLDGKRTVVDFKTAAASYEDHEVLLSDQLTAYQLAEPDCDQSAFCVLVKTKEPKIEWHLARKTGAHLTEFLAKASIVACEIAAGHFYKRPGKWCSWCDFLPVCTGDTEAADKTLVQVR